MTLKEIFLLNGGIVAGFILYKYYQYKNAMKEIDGLISKKKHSVNTALFFCASGLGDCDKHIYKKKMCEKSDCPYRKLRFPQPLLLPKTLLVSSGLDRVVRFFASHAADFFRAEMRESQQHGRRNVGEKII